MKAHWQQVVARRFRLFAFSVVLVSSHAAAQVFSSLSSFSAAGPGFNLILSGTTLYGTAAEGGNYNWGTVFAINNDGTAYTNVYSFTGGNDGAVPDCSLILSGNTVYGETSRGGTNGNGVIFAVKTDGTHFTNLYSFSPSSTNSLGTYTNSDGAIPSGGLILCGNTLFGTAQNGGRFGNGTIFKINTDGMCFTNLYSFTGGNDGANPGAGLALSGSRLYGTARYGGTNGYGVVFVVNTHGMGFANLYSFTNGSDGANPIAKLTLSGDTLYGTAEYGGTNGNGTVFAVNTNGTDFRALHNFTALDGGFFNDDGVNPLAGLILSGNTLYGTARFGGTNGFGVVFAVGTNGKCFTNLHNFTFGDDGADPVSGLILFDNTLYGTTFEGGASGGGAVFALSLGSIPMNVQTCGQNQILTWGNPAFLLQTTSAFDGPWTTLPDAASPYTVSATNTQAFYRLIYTNSL